MADAQRETARQEQLRQDAARVEQTAKSEAARMEAERQELAASAREGDATARAAIERSAGAVGAAIASASALVDLDVVAIGGGFSHVADDYIDLVQAAVARHSDFGFVTSTRVVASALSGEGPLIGAAALVHQAERVA